MPTGLNRRDAGSRDLPILVVGVDHHCAPLDVRERVAYSGADAEDVLIRLIADAAIEEALLLSTCNRTEIYLRHQNEQDAFQRGLSTVFLGRAQLRDASFQLEDRLLELKLVRHTPR